MANILDTYFDKLRDTSLRHFYDKKYIQGDKIRAYLMHRFMTIAACLSAARKHGSVPLGVSYEILCKIFELVSSVEQIQSELNNYEMTAQQFMDALASSDNGKVDLRGSIDAAAEEARNDLKNKFGGVS